VTCLGPTKVWKGEKIKLKKLKVGKRKENIIQDFKSTLLFSKKKIPL
jgi:hypothetical protein